jgi:hypothetical protein
MADLSGSFAEQNLDAGECPDPLSVVDTQMTVRVRHALQSALCLERCKFLLPIASIGSRILFLECFG